MKTDGKNKYLLLGIENQTKVDYKMLTRCMLDNDLSILFGFIKNSGNKEKLINLINNNKKYEHVNKKTIRLINEVTNINITIEEDKEEIDMCKAIEDLKKDARKEGLVEGEAKKLNENIKTMYKNGFDVETIARALSLDIVFVKKTLA